MRRGVIAWSHAAMIRRANSREDMVMSASLLLVYAAMAAPTIPIVVKAGSGRVSVPAECVSAWRIAWWNQLTVLIIAMVVFTEYAMKQPVITAMIMDAMHHDARTTLIVRREARV